MKQQIGKYTIEINVKGDTPDEATANDVFEGFMMYSIIAILQNEKGIKVNDETFIQHFAKNSETSLNEEEVSEVKAMLNKACKQGIISIDENGYYSAKVKEL